MNPRPLLRMIADLLGAQLFGPPKPGPRPAAQLPPLMLPEEFGPRPARLEPLLGGLPS